MHMEKNTITNSKRWERKLKIKAVVGVKIHAYSDALPLKLLAAII